MNIELRSLGKGALCILHADLLILEHLFYRFPVDVLIGGSFRGGDADHDDELRRLIHLFLGREILDVDGIRQECRRRLINSQKCVTPHFVGRQSDIVIRLDLVGGIGVVNYARESDGNICHI